MGAANSNIAMLRHMTIDRGMGHDVAANHVRAYDTRTDGKHHTGFMHLAIHCRTCGKFSHTVAELEECKPYDWNYKDTIQCDAGMFEKILD